MRYAERGPDSPCCFRVCFKLFFIVLLCSCRIVMVTQKFFCDPLMIFYIGLVCRDFFFFVHDSVYWGVYDWKHIQLIMCHHLLLYSCGYFHYFLSFFPPFYLFTHPAHTTFLGPRGSTYGPVAESPVCVIAHYTDPVRVCARTGPCVDV